MFEPNASIFDFQLPSPEHSAEASLSTTTLPSGLSLASGILGEERAQQLARQG
jgi:hypothetical protein